MKKLLNTLLIIAFQFGYLEWGKGYHSFIFGAEKEIFTKAPQNIMEVLHPFTVIPFIGLVLLIITLFQKTPNKYLTIIGLCCLSILMLLVLFVGTLSFNFKIIVSTIPFLIIAVLIIRANRKSS